MTDSNDSFDFQHYELIPRDETLRPPIPDHSVLNNSKPVNMVTKQKQKQKQQQKSNYEQQKLSYLKQIMQKNQSIQILREEICRLQRKLSQSTENNKNMSNFIESIKQRTNIPGSSNEQLLYTLDQLMKKSQRSIKSNQNINNNQKNHNNSSTNLQQLVNAKYNQQLLHKKQQQIRQLKAKLLQSTANNINTIFHTDLSQGQAIFKEINELKQQFHKMHQQKYQLSHTMNQNIKNPQCKHEQKITALIRSYQQMLKLYHKNQRSMQDIKAQSQQNFAYFSSLRSQLPYSIQQSCANYTEQRIFQMQKQINQMIHNIRNQSPPQPSPYPPTYPYPHLNSAHTYSLNPAYFYSYPFPIKTQQQKQQQIPIKYKFLLDQIQQLNAKLLQKQLQLDKFRQANQQLMRKSRAHDLCQIKLNKIKDMEIKIKQKQKRIYQLENTIIQQMDNIRISRAEDCSINSSQSDSQKQKNNIRNLKTIVASLNQQSKQMKQQIQKLKKQNKQLKNALSVSQLQLNNPNLNNLNNNNINNINNNSIPLVSSSPPNSPSQSYLNILQRVSKDEGSFRVIQDIVSVLVQAAAEHNNNNNGNTSNTNNGNNNGNNNGKNCKCLELTTDCLLNLNQEYPELQDVLEGLGIIQKTTNLLPMAV